MIVETLYGKVRGRRDGEGIYVFKGIPFASPPVGEKRWQSATPPEPWTETRITASTGPKCPQPPIGGLAAEILPHEIESEDCLTCNIWTPAVNDERHPVAVWIHGGGFVMGSGAWPDGAAFAKNGIVLVTFNYRLGPFGFLYLDDLFDGFEGAGNLGLLDQIRALKWVQENIAAFGGDPDNVTIFGESAGAISVASLIASDASSGLFRRAILQSGAGHQARCKEGALLVARHFCKLIGVTPGDRKALLSTSAAQLREAATKVLFTEASVVAEMLAIEDPLCGNMIFTPVIDGKFLKTRPIDAIRAGTARGIDILIGVNADEWRLVVYGMGAEAAKTIPPPDLERMKAGTDMSGTELLDSYRLVYPHKDTIELYCEILSDLTFTIPAQRLADAQATHANVYAYLFTWPTPILNGCLGSCHGLEIPFVFNQLKETRKLVGDSPPQRLADIMHECWINFMTKGRPWASEIPEWPIYTTNSPKVLRLDETPEILTDPFRDRLCRWPKW